MAPLQTVDPAAMIATAVVVAAGIIAFKIFKVGMELWRKAKDFNDDMDYQG